MEMTPKHIREHIIAEQSSPLRVKSKTKPIPVNKLDEKDQIDLGAELAGYGLQGVKVTQDELMDLMDQLGLGGEEADDLAKGLVGTSSGGKKEKPTPEEKKAEEVPIVLEDTKGKGKGKGKAVEAEAAEDKAPIPAKVDQAEPALVTKAEEVEDKATEKATEKESIAPEAKEELKEESKAPTASAPTPAETETK
jgi:SH3 domain-binding glutamic acid-rich protein